VLRGLRFATVGAKPMSTGHRAPHNPCPTLNGALPRLASQSVPAKHPPDVLPFRGVPSPLRSGRRKTDVHWTSCAPLHARVGVRPKFLSPPQSSLCGDNYFWRFNHFTISLYAIRTILWGMTTCLPFSPSISLFASFTAVFAIS